MSIALDIAVFVVICFIIWPAYRERQPWFCMIPHFLYRQCRGRGFIRQLLIFGPAVVAWLLLCHWLNGQGWHATAAGCILFAMTLGLEAMRSAEERQKTDKAG